MIIFMFYQVIAGDTYTIKFCTYTHDAESQKLNWSVVLRKVLYNRTNTD